jgi:hypothetical protein
MCAASRRARRWTVQLALVPALAVMVAACHTTRVVWSKPGGDQAELQSDLAACGRDTQAGVVDESTNRTVAVENDIPASSTRLQVSCMLKHGWRLTPLPPS